MAKETFYFTHDYNARNDLKMSVLREDYGMEGVGIYWCLIEMLYEEGGYIELAEIENITKVLRTNTTVLRGIIDSKLFQKDDKTFHSNSVLKRLQQRQDKSEKARQSILKRYERNTTEYERIRTNTIKEKKIKENKEIYKESIIPEWINKDTWNDFIEMRKKQKKPPTARAIKELINDLQKLKDAGEDIEAVILQSVKHGWISFYPLKENGDKKKSGWGVV